MKSVKFLDDVMTRHGLKNDSALAKHLCVRPGAISQDRSGTRVMDEETCLAVALSLEIDPSRVLMAAGIDRAAKTGQKSLWEVFSQRMAAPASVVLSTLFATNFLSPSTAEAASRLAPQQNQASGVCLMSNCRRKLVSALGDALKTIFASTALPATR